MPEPAPVRLRLLATALRLSTTAAIPFTRRRQTLGQLLSGTMVIRDR